MTNYNQLQTVSRQIDMLEERIHALETSGRLFASGIGRGGVNVYDSGSIRVESGGSVDVYDGGNIEVYGSSTDPGEIRVGSGGTVVADGPVSFSKSSSFSGNVTISADLVIRGNLTIKGGIIKSNALKNQMSGARTSKSVSNFSVSTSYSDKASVTLTAPSWAKTAVVFISGSAQIQSNTTSVDRSIPYVRGRITSTYSQGSVLPVVGSADDIYGGSFGVTSTISNPGKITGAIQLRANISSRALRSNKASINMFAIYYR